MQMQCNALERFTALELASRSSREVVEGYVNAEQQSFLRETVRKHLSSASKPNILNIGFNRGHSAAAFLSSCDCRVTSVDIGVHEYIHQASDLVDQVYPGRHLLIVGDSTTVVPNLEPEDPLDLVFIDGGHTRPIPWLDICNCAKIVSNGCLVVVDDYCPTYGSDGVVEAWDRAVAEGMIEQLDVFTHNDTGIVVGKYVKTLEKYSAEQ